MIMQNTKEYHSKGDRGKKEVDEPMTKGICNVLCVLH